MKVPEDKIEEISERLKAIEKLLVLKHKLPEEAFFDNSEFLQVMNISSRTAQTWREKGLISYSKVENKIYYTMTAIQEMLDQHNHKVKK